MERSGPKNRKSHEWEAGSMQMHGVTEYGGTGAVDRGAAHTLRSSSGAAAER